MGVQIETIKAGDGATFPQKGQKVSKMHVDKRERDVNGKYFSQVSCHYVLTLEGGKKVDSSRDRGRPFQFTLGKLIMDTRREDRTAKYHLCVFSGKKEVIEGWEQGIAQMSLGQRAKLTISSDLGYGPRGQGPIPGGATLIFDVELMMIQ